MIKLLAPCLFGLESVLAGEIKRLGGADIVVNDGRVAFTGDFSLLARANICLRTAERVCLVVGEFEAATFTELFDGTEALPFEEFIGRSDAFPVKGWSLKSELFGVSACQSIIKKAIVRRLEGVYRQSWFEETGPVRQVQFSIVKNSVTVMIDTSGPGLHKRGYRENATLAPIKETLAAGIVDLAHIRAGDMVVDPMCGSGTLLIEAAMRAFHVAPGVRRRFAAERWNQIEAAVWQRERERALEEIRKDIGFSALGFDVDDQAITLTNSNAQKAGVGKRISAVMRDIRDAGEVPFGPDAVVLCNPPYGERLLEIREAEKLYRELGRFCREQQRCYIISPHENFEEIFGRRAKKRRKLYNGMIKCQLYMYF